jgi:hypothetical protein
MESLMTMQEQLAYQSGYNDGYKGFVKDKDPKYPTWYNNGYKKGFALSPIPSRGNSERFHR